MSDIVKPRNEALEAAIRSNPESPDAYLVYGDWLLENGDPLGELVSVQSALAKKQSAALKKREKALLAEHSKDWLGPLSGDEHTWAFGFLESVTLSDPTRARYRALLELGAARFLQSLDIELSTDFRTNLHLVRTMGELGVPATLRRLGLNTLSDLPHMELGDISVIYRHLGSLRDLHIRASRVALGRIQLPMLESFALTGAFSTEVLRSIVNATWPKLESLALEWTRRIPDDQFVAELLAALARPDAPKLHHLGIAGTGHGGAFLADFSTSPITRGLQSLDLSRSAIIDEEARVLLDRSSAFLHLESIDLRENDLSDEMCSALEKVYGIAVDTDDQGATGYDDEDEDRYDDIHE